MNRHWRKQQLPSSIAFRHIRNCSLMVLLVSGRAWPYHHNSLARLLPSPKDVAASTLSMTMDLVMIDWIESVIDMLRRLDLEQCLLDSYQHVPLANSFAHLTVQDHAMWQATLRQSFNWKLFGTYHHSQVFNPINWHLMTPIRDFC